MNTLHLRKIITFMKHRLLPSFYRSIGYFILILCLGISLFCVLTEQVVSFPFTGVFALYFKGVFSEKTEWFAWIHHLDYGITALGTGWWVATLLIALSKEKQEDEFVWDLRFNALWWALATQAVLILVGWLFLFEWVFFQFMFYQSILAWWMYILRFRYLVWRSKPQNT